MRFFPKVHSPCPYKGTLADILDGDICRLCKREVHDLSAMAEADKQALFADCSDDVCVTYRIDARPALAAIAIGAGVFAPTALAAQDAATQEDSAEISFADENGEEFWIIVGGARPDGVAAFQSEEEIRQERQLPIVYEDAPPQEPAQAEQHVAEPREA